MTIMTGISNDGSAVQSCCCFPMLRARSLEQRPHHENLDANKGMPGHSTKELLLLKRLILAQDVAQILRVWGTSMLASQAPKSHVFTAASCADGCSIDGQVLPWQTHLPFLFPLLSAPQPSLCIDQVACDEQRARLQP